MKKRGVSQKKLTKNNLGNAYIYLNNFPVWRRPGWNTLTDFKYIGATYFQLLKFKMWLKEILFEEINVIYIFTPLF